MQRGAGPLSETGKQAAAEPFRPDHKGFYATATIDRVPPLPPKVARILFAALAAKQRQSRHLRMHITIKHGPPGPPVAAAAASHCQDDILSDTSVSAATCWYFRTNNMRFWPVSEIPRQPIHQRGILYRCPIAGVAALVLTPTATFHSPVGFAFTCYLLRKPSLPTSAHHAVAFDRLLMTARSMNFYFCLVS